MEACEVCAAGDPSPENHRMRPVAINEPAAGAYTGQRYRMRGNLYLRISTNWAEALRHCLGPMMEPDPLLELQRGSLALYVTDDRALLLVDREPVAQCSGGAVYQPCLLAVAGFRLERVGGIAVCDGPVLRGRYAGLLGGQRVVLDQYMHMPNTALRARAQVVRKVTRPAKQEPFEHMALACMLMQEPEG